MSITLTQIVGRVLVPSGAIPRNGRISFTLSGWDTEGASIIPHGPVDFPLDGAGKLNAFLWPTVMGDQNRRYAVRVTYWSLLTGRIETEALPDIQVPVSATALTLAEVIGAPLTPTVPPPPSVEPYVILIMGQSLAEGVYGGGPNPASALVKTWDVVTGAWGGSDYTGLPWSRSTPAGAGNGGNNNYALARAHRIAADTGRPVYIVFDAVGGTSIDEWVASGTASVRYAAAKSKVEAALATLAGKTVVDEIIWAQGEADFRDGYSEHLGNLVLLRNQIRAETWCNYETQIYMCGPSNLHDRYMWQTAMQYFCSSVDNRCIFVPSNALRTPYDTIGVGTPVPGTGDFTHFLGESIWEMGYYRIADARPVETAPVLYFNRGNGPANAGDTQVISTWDTLISFQSRTGGSGLSETLSGTGAQTVFPLDYRGTSISEVTVGGVVVASGDYTHTGTNDSVAGRSITFTTAPASGTNNIVVAYSAAPNAPGMTGGIGFGYANYPDGNYTYLLGYENWSANLCNYTGLIGRENGATANADYGFATGFQQLLDAPYAFAAGRGHIPSDDGGAAVGMFSEYRTAQTDDVLFQVGNGTSVSVASNAFAVRASGILEAKDLPAFANNAAALAGLMTAGQIYRTAAGELRIVV